MRHFQEFSATGDIVSQVQLQNINNKTVAKCQLGIVSERTMNGQKQQHMNKMQIEVWGPQANFLASIPQGHTIIVKGKVEQYKYKGQDGVEKWATKVSVFTVGHCGPSIYGQQAQQQGYQQQGGYPQQGAPAPQTNAYPPQQQQQAPRGGYGAAPTGYPPPQQSLPNYAPQGATGYPPQAAQNPPAFDPNEQIPF